MQKNIIEIARKICELGFMDYPDYDPEIEMDLADALTIIISESQHLTGDETPSHEIYDFLEKELSQEDQEILYCKKYTGEALPDEDDNCSLCGGNCNKY